MLPGKDELNTIDILISGALIHSDVNHDESLSINNVLREYNELKKEIKNLEASKECTISKWEAEKRMKEMI